MDERLARDRDELKPFDSAEAAFNTKPIAGKGLSADEAKQKYVDLIDSLRG